MKNIKSFIYAVVCLAALCLQANVCAKQTGNMGAEARVEVNNAAQMVNEASLAAQVIKLEAEKAIDQAEGQLKNGKITPAEAAKIIGQNRFKISQAEEELAALTEDTIEQLGLGQRFIAGVRNVGQGAVSLARTGYIYSEEEKAIALEIIKELEARLENSENLEEQDRQELENALAEQRAIAGEAMSSTMKRFWAAVGLAGAVSGAALAARSYFTTPTGLSAEEMQKAGEEMIARADEERRMERAVEGMEYPPTFWENIKAGWSSRFPSESKQAYLERVNRNPEVNEVSGLETRSPEEQDAFAKKQWENAKESVGNAAASVQQSIANAKNAIQRGAENLNKKASDAAVAVEAKLQQAQNRLGQIPGQVSGTFLPSTRLEDVQAEGMKREGARKIAVANADNTKSPAEIRAENDAEIARKKAAKKNEKPLTKKQQEKLDRSQQGPQGGFTNKRSQADEKEKKTLQNRNITLAEPLRQAKHHLNKMQNKLDSIVTSQRSMPRGQRGGAKEDREYKKQEEAVIAAQETVNRTENEIAANKRRLAELG